MRHITTAGFVAAVALASTEARAQVTPEITVDQAQADALGLDVAAINAELGTLIEDNLKLDEVETFLDSMANAGAISAKGMGVDYASNPQRFVVGGSVGTGVHAAGFTFGNGKETLPTGGFAAQVSLMAGVNLGGIFGAKEGSFGRRFLIYANGMAMPMPSGSPFGGSMYNVGGHLQIRLIGSVNAKVVEWGGLAVTGGFERSSYVLSLKQELPLSAPVSGADLAWTASGDYQITATTDAIPIEASTNLRLAVVTIFAGGGVDLNTGNSIATASVDGPIEATVQGETAEIGTAKVSFSADGLADEMVPRAFVGAQVNVLMVKAYGQLNIGFNESLGGHVGLRVAI